MHGGCVQRLVGISDSLVRPFSINSGRLLVSPPEIKRFLLTLLHCYESLVPRMTLIMALNDARFSLLFIFARVSDPCTWRERCATWHSRKYYSETFSTDAACTGMLREIYLEIEDTLCHDCLDES